MKKEYFVQALMTFFSVFLGIMATNWNDDYAKSQKAKSFLHNLHTELKGNQTRLKKAITYHKQLQKTTDSLFKVSGKKGLQTLFFEFGGFQKIPHWSGLGTVIMEDDMYQSGIMGNIFENIPLELVSKITRVITIQKEYTRFCSLLSEKLIQLNFDSKLSDILIITNILGYDVARLEEQLFLHYENLLSELVKTEKAL